MLLQPHKTILKKEDNIIEYVLFMFYTEDLLRSLQLNPKLVYQVLIEKAKISQEEKLKQAQWYTVIIDNMEAENIQETGHLSIVKEAIGELSYVHKLALNHKKEDEYIILWKEAYPSILDIAEKSNGQALNPIELCFNGLYGVLTLRMNKRDIGHETIEAVKKFTNLLNYLRNEYHKIAKTNLK